MLDTTRPNSVASKTSRANTIARVSTCRACQACWNGNGPVAPWGPTPNDIMIIGEAPTRVDDRRGQTSLMGDASILLRRLLARVELDLDRLFFVNTIQCWPDTVNIPVAISRSCSPNLKAYLQLCEPTHILTLGSYALNAVTDRKRTLTQDHGQPFTPLAGPFMGRLIFPTFHPAALAHSPSAETLLSADIVEFSRIYQESRRLP